MRKGKPDFATLAAKLIVACKSALRLIDNREWTWDQRLSCLAELRMVIAEAEVELPESEEMKMQKGEYRLKFWRVDGHIYEMFSLGCDTMSKKRIYIDGEVENFRDFDTIPQAEAGVLELITAALRVNGTQ